MLLLLKFIYSKVIPLQVASQGGYFKEVTYQELN